jgi:hypothetical protein
MSYPVRVGSIRPSQLMWSYGVGAMIDLPRLSVMVQGLEAWNTQNCRPISEDRLLSAVRKELGPQVSRLYEPPLPETDPYAADETDPVHRIGVPVQVFPQWLRCPRCGLMSDVDSGVFAFKGKNTRPDDAQYMHENCTKRGKGSPPACVAARFLVACEAGHLDDFPWREFVHRGPTSCTGTLRFYEKGSSLETANLFVACDNGLGFSNNAPGEEDHPGAATGGCGQRPRSLVDAFGESAKSALPKCRGRHPHLLQAGGCGRPLRTILLGSSNSWFPKTLSALSIPTGGTELDQAVEDRWDILEAVEEESDIRLFRRTNQLGGATKFSDEEIWEAIQRRRSGTQQSVSTEDMKQPEWMVLCDPGSAPRTSEFHVTLGKAPTGLDKWLLPTVAVEKIREVNALLGFTRLEAPEDLLQGDNSLTFAPLSRNKPEWVPASEVRGEGILVRFRPEVIAHWENDAEVAAHLEALKEANKLWRAARRMPTDRGYPGNRHVLLHTFSHLLMRELALECGYSSASIRERIYASAPDKGDMAGVLIYTAAPDSEGTLGGLVRLAEAATLGRLIAQALEHARLCASDPLCAEHDPVPDRSLHGASCHACTFAPETACEFGNRFLDRATVVTTFATSGIAFFD